MSKQKSKGKRRGPKPRPLDKFWRKYWPHVSQNNKQRFYEAYDRSMKLTGQHPLGWTIEYPIFRMSRELMVQMMEDDNLG